MPGKLSTDGLRDREGERLRRRLHSPRPSSELLDQNHAVAMNARATGYSEHRWLSHRVFLLVTAGCIGSATMAGRRATPALPLRIAMQRTTLLGNRRPGNCREGRARHSAPAKTRAANAIIAAPAPRFAHRMARAETRLRNAPTSTLNTSHHEAEPTNTPITRLEADA